VTFRAFENGGTGAFDAGFELVDSSAHEAAIGESL
jgi:hypothetical protein